MIIVRYFRRVWRAAVCSEPYCGPFMVSTLVRRGMTFDAALRQVDYENACRLLAWHRGE